jgi:autotransporter-associated beta strand protein
MCRKLMLPAFIMSLVLSATLTNRAFALAGPITGPTLWSAANILPTDNVVVENNATLTVDVGNATCMSLTLGSTQAPSAGAGRLSFVSGAKLTVQNTVTVGNAVPSLLGTIDMSLGGTLNIITNSTPISAPNAAFIPGSGTINFADGGALPSAAVFSTYNVLSIASGTGILSQAVTASTLNLGTGASSGVLELGGFNFITSSVNILGGNANSITNSAGAATLTFNVPSSTVTFNSPITGAQMSVAKDGFGTLILSGGANTYGGGTTVINGTLQMGASNSLPPNGNLTLGTLGNSGMCDLHGFSQTIGTLLTSGTGNSNTLTNSTGQAQLMLNNPAGQTFSGAITGTGLTLNLNGSYMLSGGVNNTFSGNINVLTGTLSIGLDNSLSQSSILTLGSGSNSAIFDLNGHSQRVAGVGTSGTSLSNTITCSGAAGTFTVGSQLSPQQSSTFIGQIQSLLTLAIDAGTSLTLGGNPAYGGGTQVINGTLRFGQAFPSFGPVTLGGGNTAGTLDLNGFDETIFALASSGTSTSNSVRDSTAASPQMARTLTLNQSSSTNYTGQCSAILSMNGSGTLTLKQSNAVTLLNVLNGTVFCGAPNVFTSGTTALTLGGSSTFGKFDLNGFGQTVGTISTNNFGPNQITTSLGSPATLSIQNSQPNNPFTFNGTIDNGISLILSTNSSSPFTYSGGSYTGSTTVNAGEIVLQSANAGGSAFTLNGSSGGPLSGVGSVGPLTVKTAAIVSPGNAAVGNLNCTSADFSGGGALKVKIPSNSTSDTLTVFGTLTMGGTSQLALDLTGYDGLMPPTTFQIATASLLSGTFPPPLVTNNNSGYAVEVTYDNALHVVKAKVGAPPTVNPNAFGTATAGTFYSYNISATNSPSSYSATALPQGLNLNAGTGQISGVPTVAGNYNVMLTATNKGGTSATVTLPLSVVAGSVNKLQTLLPGESPAPGTLSGKSGTPLAQTAGISFNLTVNAVDMNWNIVNVSDTLTLSSNDTFAVLPAIDPVLIAGSATISITLKAASPPQPPHQPTTLTATDFSVGSTAPSTSSTVVVNPAGFAKLQILLPGEVAAPGSATGKTGTPAQQQATAPFQVQVNAVDSFFNVVNTVIDTVTLASTDTHAVLPPNTMLNNGTVNLPVTLNLGPTQTISVSDFTAGATPGDTSPAVTVKPGTFVKLQVLAPGETNAPGAPGGKTGAPLAQTGGTPFVITVNAVDVNFTIVPVSDVVRLSTSDPGGILPADMPMTNGTAQLNLTLTTGPAQTVSASDVSDPNKFSQPSSSIIVSTIASTLSAVSPNAGVQNGAGFTITVTGTNFLSGSVVQWNGSNRPTTFVSSTQLTALIPASDLVDAGRVNVTVFSPPPGTGATTPVTFFVYSGTVINSWIVSTTSDSGQGSLRLALDSCRAGDTITFDPVVFALDNSDAATVINTRSDLPHLSSGSITIDANGRRVTVNGSAAGSSNGLTLESDGNKVINLSIVNFQSSGIEIGPNASNNTIGGDRTVGTGVNGQGLRLSGNGTFGLALTGPNCTGNTIKGCWIGLDAGGQQAQPNLAGIIIQGGAALNTIGGTSAGEGNVISGNFFEGITVSGSGSDNNIILGNVIGASAVTTTTASRGVASRDDSISGRSDVANGSAGMFISRGTTSTQAGGSNAGEGNTIAYNGGNGVEVRTSNSKKNSVRGNSIGKNKRGGITLFDGSNNGIQAPTISSVITLSSTADTIAGRSTASVRVAGTASTGGTIELFNDSGSQGESLLGRSSVASDLTFTSDISADTTQNITATLTDSSGNTSTFAVYTPSSTSGGGTGTATDSDGDGFPDELETALNTNPADATSTPFSGQSAGTSTTLSGVILGVKLNFAKTTSNDSLSLSTTLNIGTASLANQTVVVDVGGIVRSFTLDANGKSTTKGLTLSKPKNGSTKLVMKLTKSTLAASLADEGLTGDADIKTAVSKSIDVIVLFNSTFYETTKTVSYTAKNGVSGTAK